MVHKPKHKVHSFRGLLGDGGEDEINLERSNVNIAYRLTKFQCMQDGFGNTEMVIKIYREEQGTPTNAIDFGEPDLLGACMLSASSSGESNPDDIIIIFDATILFSRNIYIGAAASSNADPTNYYIEIEEVPVGAATLMQIKLGTARTIKTKQSMGSG